MANSFLAVSLLCALLPASIAHGQRPSQPDLPGARSELANALAPLKGLTPEQMNAAAALVLASRAGIDVGDYCPPLKQFAHPDPVRCLGEIAAYSSAVKDCKKANPTWKDCPKVLEADAAWATCEFGNLSAILREIRALRIPPRPAPQRRPPRSN